MANKPRAKMPPSQRAKQFAPFDALTGLRLALKEKEKIRVPRITVSEDIEEEINRVLTSLKKEEVITVVYYNEPEQEYLQLTGKVTAINKEKRILQIETREINIDDIYRCFY